MRTLFTIDIVLGDFKHLMQVLLGIDNNHRGHKFANRGNRQDHIGILFKHDFAAV
jgi:hypothetical protein